MVEKIVGKITLSDDVAVGEIIQLDVIVDGERTGVLIAVRVVHFDGGTALISMSDLPRETVKKNTAAALKLLQMNGVWLN